MRKFLPIVTAVALAAPLPALAHVVVTPSSGAPAAVVNAEFKAGHGCGELKTTSLRVEIPAAIGMVHAHDTPGWTIKLEKKGKQTTAVTWTAGKGAKVTEPVSAHLLLPETKQTLYFPTTQTCGKTVVKWNEQPGGKPVDKHPAPSIVVGGAPTSAPMPGMPMGDGHEDHKH